MNKNAADNRPSVSSSIKRDSKVVGQIPAVDKARDTLRKRSIGAGLGGGRISGERVTGDRDREKDGDEKSTPSSGGTGTSIWSKKGTSAGVAAGSVGRPGAPGMGRSNSGGIGGGQSQSFGGGGTSFGKKVRVLEPDK